MRLNLTIRKRIFFLLLIFLYLPTVFIVYFVVHSTQINVSEKFNKEIIQKKKYAQYYFRKSYSQFLSLAEQLSTNKLILNIVNTYLVYQEPEVAKKKLLNFKRNLNSTLLQIYSSEKKLILTTENNFINLPTSIFKKKPEYFYLDYNNKIYFIVTVPLYIGTEFAKKIYSYIALIRVLDRNYINALYYALDLPVKISTNKNSISSKIEKNKYFKKIPIIIGNTLIGDPVKLTIFYDISFFVKFKKENNFLFLFILIGTFIFCLIISILLSNVIINPIKFLDNMISEIEAGKFKLKEIKYFSKDEIYNIVEKLNSFFDRLRKNFLSIYDKTKNGSEKFSNIKNDFNKLYSNIESIKSNSSKLSNSCNLINSQLDNQKNSIEILKREFQENLNLIEKLKNLSEEGFEISKISNVTFKEINRNSQEIKNFLDFITDISSQINLLSVNAAIESIKSGESGSGFSVVADEIKKLAQTINDFVENIRKLIENNYNIVKQGVEYSNRLDKILTELNEYEENVYSLFKDIQKFINSCEEFIDNLKKDVKFPEEINRLNEADIKNILNVTIDVEKKIEEIKKELENIKEIVGDYVEKKTDI